MNSTHEKSEPLSPLFCSSPFFYSSHSFFQIRLVERLHLDFVRQGARFDGAAQARHAEISERLAELMTAFSQNILADESEFTMVLKVEDLSGCPADLVAAAR